MMSTALTAETVDFLRLFFGSDERICFRAFPPKGISGSPSKRYGSLSALQNGSGVREELYRLNRRHGVYFVVNQGGDADNEIRRFNACFAESDTNTIEEQHRRLDAGPLPTTIRIETARSVHAYWLLRGDVSLADWKDMQNRLISFFDADPSIKNPSRVMRVPGFDHIDKDDTRTRVKMVQSNPERVYTIAELLAAFPAAEKTGTKPEHFRNGNQTSGHFATWDALRAELGRRIMAHPTTRQNGSGNWDCRGICHDGEGNTGLFYNPSTNQAHCNSYCEQAAILRAFRLPEQPDLQEREQPKIITNHSSIDEERQAIQDEGSEPKGDPSNGEPNIPTEQKSQIVRLSDINPEQVHWLWHPRIPLGKVTLIDGDPGLGKSFVTLAIATAVSLGRGISEQTAEEPAPVLLLSAEDGLADTVRPRLDAMRADCTRILALNGRVILDAVGCVALDEMLNEHKPRLVVIDPLFAYTGAKVDINRANETRDIMTRLAALAEKHGCAIVCVRHLTKGGRDKSIYRGVGSIDLTAACRSVLLVGADANNRDRRAIVQIKNNLAPLANPIGYSLENGVFAWTGTSDLTADQILANEQTATDALTLEEAVQFLEQLLAPGPMDQPAVKKAAYKAGISERTLYRAKARLKVDSGKSGFGGDGGWAWKLAK
jgi:hypothetical protein